MNQLFEAGLEFQTLIRQKGQLDKKYILEKLKPLCKIKENSEIIKKNEVLMKRY